MNHRLIPLPFPSLRFLPGLLAACGLVTSIASAQTYSKQITPIGGTGAATNKTSSGYTETYTTIPLGGIDYTAMGLTLAYTNFGANQYAAIANVSDITGSGIQLDRYLSFTLAPDNFADLAGYSGSYTVDLVSFSHSVPLDNANEHFQVRTSLDNFANPLANWSNSTDRPDSLAPGLNLSGPFVRTNGNVVTTDAPLVVRLYTWYDQAGGDGVPGYTGSLASGWKVNYIVTVPEPSSALLLGLAGVLPLLHRRRA